MLTWELFEMTESDPIVREFLVESHENLGSIDNHLLALEKSPDSSGELEEIFRAIHTVKGTCGFLGFTRLESLTHAGESLLSQIRRGLVRVDREVVDVLLQLVDAVRAVLGRIESTGQEGDQDHASLIALLEEKCVQNEVEHGLESDELAPAQQGPHDSRLASVLMQAGMVSVEHIRSALARQAAGDGRYIGEILVASGALSDQDLTRALERQERAQAPAVVRNSVRVSVELLDQLMNLVGELVLTRNQLTELRATSRDRAFQSAAQRLSLITTDLQQGVMQARMQPIGTLLDKLPRLVRDLASVAGRRVRLELDGRETELDRTIVEAISDPLTHILRNAVDHGIEPPEARVAAGKPAEGVLRVRAYHEGGQVNIEITDDGAGINTERVRTCAVRTGLLQQDEATQLGERELIQLIFEPGFSTAETVSRISGRGVGMDVVRTNIEKIGGTIDLQSTRYKGTRILIRIPLTLAIIPALIAHCAGERYAIPQVSLAELVRIPPDAQTGLEDILGTSFYRLRGNLIPVVFLREVLRLGRADAPLGPIVILQADRQVFGVIVDDVAETQEIVVKPLGRHIGTSGCWAGATMMGDGRVALIVDVLGLAQQSGVLHNARRSLAAHELASRKGAGSAAPQRGSAPAAAPAPKETRALLLFMTGPERRMAVPLERVVRLEDFAASALELAGGAPVVQYRGGILPLIDLRREFATPLADEAGPPAAAEPARSATAAPERVPVIVHGGAGESVGLVVESILDIVHGEGSIDVSRRLAGIAGSLVLQGRVTDLLDVEALVAAAGLGAAREGAVEAGA